MKKIFIVLLLTCLSLGVNAAQNDTLRVLMIGNSFADDCAEYFDDLAIAADRPLILGVLYRGGCSLARHCSYYDKGEAPYDYRKRVLGVYTNTKKISLLTGLKDEKWDVITIQQQSFDASQIKTFYPYVTRLLDIVESNWLQKAEIYFVQTWAYGADMAKKPKHKNGAKFLEGFGGDQMAMYTAITRNAKRITKENKLKIIPVGTAIQNARAAMGDIMTRDGYHLDMTIGRYVAACTMFETLMGESVCGNSYRVEGVSEEKSVAAQMAASAAVKRSWKVSSMK